MLNEGHSTCFQRCLTGDGTKARDEKKFASPAVIRGIETLVTGVDNPVLLGPRTFQALKGSGKRRLLLGLLLTLPLLRIADKIGES